MLEKVTFVSIFYTLFFIAIAQVNDSCIDKISNRQGVCKRFADCALAKKQARKGITPTLCRIEKFTQPIVCCVDTVSNVPPNENPSSTVNTENLRISEKKCKEYTRQVTQVTRFTSLVANTKPIDKSKPKCEFNSVPLIHNGEPALPGEFPYMAAIGFDTDEDIWRCGGTLISDRYVLTAAHCTFSRNGYPTIIRLGALYLSDINGSQHKDYLISNVIPHPDYDDEVRKYNDIALLQTKTRVEFTDFIRPACLATSESLEIGTPIATGWGLTRHDQSSSDKLLKVSLKVFNNNICSRHFKDEDKVPDGIIASMICAGSRNSSNLKDTCLGDSGGPLAVTSKSNVCQSYVIGITSFGKPCGVAPIPGVYTRVLKFVSWIEKTVWPEL